MKIRQIAVLIAVLIGTVAPVWAQEDEPQAPTIEEELQYFPLYTAEDIQAINAMQLNPDTDYLLQLRDSAKLAVEVAAKQQESSARVFKALLFDLHESYLTVYGNAVGTIQPCREVLALWVAYHDWMLRLLIQLTLDRQVPQQYYLDRLHDSAATYYAASQQ